MARTLLEHLRAQDDETLGALLRARPDLALPAPADTGVVATRAGVRTSVGRACEDLDELHLALVDALLVAEADQSPADPADVLGLLGADVPPERGRAALDRLRVLALVWDVPDDGGGPVRVRAVPALRDTARRYPAGLGRPAPSPSVLHEKDPASVMAGLPDDQRAVVVALDRDGPVGRSRAKEGDDNPVARLLADGILRRIDDDTVELTREAGLGLRGDRPLGPLVAADPMPAPRVQDPATIDATAAGEALETVRRAEGVLAAWSAAPPAVLRSGGLGVRDLRRLAKTLDVDETAAGLVVETLAAASLLAVSEDADAVWCPTTTADRWLASPPETQWVALARAWLEMPRQPSSIGQRDSMDKLVGPLSDEVRRPWAAQVRRRVLARLAEFDDGAGPVSVDALVESLAWRAPRRGGRQRDELVRATVREATALGVVALDAITTAGRELLRVPRRPDDDPDAAAAAALRPAMPAPVGHILLQADLTAVAPGRLEPDLAAAMDRLADVESAGGATVYRISEGSIRRALDLGWTAADVHALFSERSATPVPQGLTYLVDDVARRHGRLRGGSAASFLRSEDEALLVEVMALPTAEALGLRRLAPTVVISTSPLAEVLDALRAAGLSPVAEDADGGVLDLRPRGRRTAPRRPDRSGTGSPWLSDDQIAALVAQLRAGDRAATAARGSATVPGSTRQTASATVAVLADAARTGRTVWIGYVDAAGTASQRVVRPLRVGGGLLEGTDAAVEAEDTGPGSAVSFALHRITSVSVLTEN
ncbi:helicase-associated domain-containing protein [Actinomycetospora corticicola]|uniref:Helicase XPB/Ssl2 N-terminal domain-containing protein n=1 Tax=Actinomycetospora corticicola TaxID=663602 RepID=A0A7Y9J8F2_9PSEU|nr:helicase-associated domain-containing protein [Actinomycetospora corticicola]NYD39233.1 hypothetical protein [Actinomycetospora corticicola]